LRRCDRAVIQWFMGLKPRREPPAKIGSLIYQLGDGSAQAADELASVCSSMNAGSRDILDVAAIAIGEELADMGDRGGFIMNVTYGSALGDYDIEELVGEAEGAIDPFHLGPPLMKTFNELLVTRGLATSLDSDLGEPGTRRGSLLWDGFEKAVRPRLVRAIERHRRERS